MSLYNKECEKQFGNLKTIIKPITVRVKRFDDKFQTKTIYDVTFYREDGRCRHMIIEREDLVERIAEYLNRDLTDENKLFSKPVAITKQSVKLSNDVREYKKKRVKGFSYRSIRLFLSSIA